MKLRNILLLSALLTSTSAPAFAAGPFAPNLSVTLTSPVGAKVYETRRYTYKVKNEGNRTAAGSKLIITLPRTGTSPHVYIMGQLVGYTAGCTLAGTTLTCPLGDLIKNQSKNVFVDLNLPYSTEPIVLDATATTTTSPETNATNNRVVRNAALGTYPVTMSYIDPVVHQHCTGNTWLSSFFECTLFPSSITEHEATFNTDNTISIPAAPSYTGTWIYRPTENRLQFTYFDGAVRIVDFDGRGVGGNCFEGKTVFPNSTSTYISMYRICFP